MNVFYGEIYEDHALLDSDETRHCIKVLRQKPLDKVIVTNGVGLAVVGRISSFNKKETRIDELHYYELPSVSTGIHIAIAPTKNLDRFEFFLEKAIEMGVSEITPILTHHSERKHINIEKLQKKAIAACKQSLRSDFVTVNPLIALTDFISEKENSTFYLSHCNTKYKRVSCTSISEFKNTLFLIGPEGDFSEEEIKQLSTLKNLTSISLGENRLRTETAGVFIAQLAYLNGLE